MLVESLAQSSGGGSSSGGSLLGLALPILMLGGFYFLLIRPQRNKQRAQQTLLAQLEVGDEVMTTGGIFGTIVAIDEDEGVLTVEIAPGTQVKMLRQGVAQRFVEGEDGAGEDLVDDDEDTEEADRTP